MLTGWLLGLLQDCEILQRDCRKQSAILSAHWPFTDETFCQTDTPPGDLIADGIEPPRDGSITAQRQDRSCAADLGDVLLSTVGAFTADWALAVVLPAASAWAHR
jgi:hypothetical protein